MVKELNLKNSNNALETSEHPTSVIKVQNVTIRYGKVAAVTDCNLDFQKNRVTAIIGPSGCGKSTLLRSLNRMNDYIEGFSLEGKVLLGKEDIYDRKADPVWIRRRVGMVFQKPNPFPRSIFKNIVWGPSINGFTGNKSELVEDSLKAAGLWSEVKDRLNQSAMTLSGGQQQRLCIARAIAMKPEVILMDEPASALDPKSTSRVEDLIGELRKRYTIIIVTHNMQQAARISDQTAFLYNGNLIEFGATSQIFTNPIKQETEDYITGRFG